LFAKERKEIQNSRWFTIGSIAENILFVEKSNSKIMLISFAN